MIRRWNLVDYVKSKFISNISRLDKNPNYVIIGNFEDKALIKCLSILKKIIIENKLQQLHYSAKSNHLKLNIHSLLTERKLIDKITGIE